ncbi:MAG TPA: DUF4388 domain-containing protein [Anaerolineae bacterium]
MAIKGDLQDMSLASLMQMLCLDQRKATLVLKRSQADQGAIFFDSGRIVHAEVGSLIGEAAVYHLLSWGDGTFEMNEQQIIPSQTITVPWNHLIMEGMRLIDERQMVEPQQLEAEVVLSEAEIEQDDVLENELILFLSELEQVQIRLADQKTQKHPPVALQHLTDIVNQVVAFAERLPDEAANTATLSKVINRAADTYPTIKLLRVHENYLSSEIVSHLYNGWTGDARERKETFGELSHGMLKVIEIYFSYFIAYFRSGTVAGRWHETCDIFMSALNQEVKKVRF